MLVGGEAELDGEPLELYALYVLRPGHEARLSSASGGRLMLMGGQAFSTRRYVFWNFVSSSRDRINQAKEDWKALRFAAHPRRRPGIHSAARGAQDGQLSVTEFRRVALEHRRYVQRRARGRSDETGGHPAPRLSRIASHLA